MDQTPTPATRRPWRPRTALLLRAACLSLLLGLGLGVPAVSADPRPAAAPPIVLGAPDHYGEYGEGWGTARPRVVYNGGVPNGRAYDLRWRGWGKPVAIGRGWLPIYRPDGGYYERPGRVLLKAQRVGSCDGRRAYTRLFVRVAPRPGAAPRKGWRPWAGGGSLCETW